MEASLSTPEPAHDWTVGQLVDVVSPDQIVYPARILSVGATVRIHYIGWLDQDDEDIVDFSRILPFGSYTTPVKAWVRLSSKFCAWPCTLYLLKPLTDIGLSFLKMEKNCIVIPAGPATGGPLRPYKHGVFMCNTKIKPFEPSSRYIASGRDVKNSKYRACFEEALLELAASSALSIPFKLHGAWNTTFANPFRSVTPAKAPTPPPVPSASLPKKRKVSDEMVCAMDGYYSGEHTSLNLISDFELDEANDNIASLFMHIFENSSQDINVEDQTVISDVVTHDFGVAHRKQLEPKQNSTRKLRQMKMVTASFPYDFDNIVDGGKL